MPNELHGQPAPASANTRHADPAPDTGNDPPSDNSPTGNLSSEPGAIAAHYLAKIAAVRQGSPRNQVAALVQALRTEKKLAMRAATDGRRTASRSKHQPSNKPPAAPRA